MDKIICLPESARRLRGRFALALETFSKDLVASEPTKTGSRGDRLRESVEANDAALIVKPRISTIRRSVGGNKARYCAYFKYEGASDATYAASSSTSPVACGVL